MANSSLNFPSIDSAIQQMEGYYPGSLSYKNNNPGNLVSGDFASQYGGTPGAGGFAQFPSYSAGQQAQDALVTQYANKGYTLDQLINAWAPSSDGNNTQNYQNFMAQQLGVSGSTPLIQLQNTSASNASGGFGSSILNAANPFSGIGGQTVQENLQSIAQSGLSWGRVATFVAGSILLVIGLFNLRPVQRVVTGVSRTAGKIASKIPVTEVAA